MTPKPPPPVPPPPYDVEAVFHMAVEQLLAIRIVALREAESEGE